MRLEWHCMQHVLLLVRRVAAVALAAVSMGLHAPVFAASISENAHAPNSDCAGMPAGACTDMAGCVEHLPAALNAMQAPQSAMQSPAVDSLRAVPERSVMQMPIAPIARYGPPAYLEFHSLLL